MRRMDGAYGKPFRSVSGVGALLALAFAATPSLAGTIYIGTSTNGGTTITTEATGSTPDALPITWNGTVAGLGVGVSAADVQPSDPRLGSTDLSGSTSTSSSGTIWVFVSETGLTSSSAMKTLTSYFSDNVIPSGWSVTETAWEGGNSAYSLGTELATVTFGPGGPYAPPGVVSTPTVSSPYSVTEEYEVTWSGAGSIELTEKVIGSPIPEPSTWAMLLIGAAGLGLAARRNGRKHRLASVFE